MVLIDTPTAILATAIGIWVLVETRSLRAMVEFGIGGIPPVAMQLAYNTWIFDSPFTFAYAHKASGDLATIHEQGLFWILNTHVGTTVWTIIWYRARVVFMRLYYCSHSSVESELVHS